MKTLIALLLIALTTACEYNTTTMDINVKGKSPTVTPATVVPKVTETVVAPVIPKRALFGLKFFNDGRSIVFYSNNTSAKMDTQTAADLTVQAIPIYVAYLFDPEETDSDLFKMINTDWAYQALGSYYQDGRSKIIVTGEGLNWREVGGKTDNTVYSWEN